MKLFTTEKQIAKEELEKYMNEINEDICLDYEERHRITDEEIIKLIEEEYEVKKGLYHLLGRQEKDMILKNLKEINEVLQ
ncbi:hypothetical protein SAMN05446037_1005206 [Anaerovirgula multivorans]|uniref:Uncharacterized protein n=1 Tax=Anaerovirgula multivorans TaxID=312168 RepID=A0A239CJ27_9FIRM|nr:hypothetical protein [Anaerovirgula multivorans]SNS19353.1 hypothetical protein SAMN05446037_1005206 [Anaerovirgula multivorans]